MWPAPPIPMAEKSSCMLWLRRNERTVQNPSLVCQMFGPLLTYL